MNNFGTIFKISIFGESHGKAVGVTIDGCPPGIFLPESDFEHDLLRRKSGATGTTKRTETDKPIFLSGIKNLLTTGSPITIIFENNDTKSGDYNFAEIPRPSHADFTAVKKYFGFADLNGSGHFSGRLTTGIVAAGVIAKKIINPAIVSAKITEAGGSANIKQKITEAIEKNDSVGAKIFCKVENVPAGWGEPFFNSVESLIAHAIFSVPGIKAIEFGSGFEAAKMFGSQHNDTFIDETGKTATNFAGGINGGITNGNQIYFNTAVKPASSIPQEQRTFNFKTKKTDILKIGGRHDAFIAMRAVPVIEAVTAIVLADLFLIRKTQKNDN